MKPIGPYVAARELPAGPNPGPIRTLRATDRLTGMPVLLHLLPFAPRLQDLPDHPGLLPVVDRGMDEGHTYVVSELPMQAAAASDPLLAARDALAALSALHTCGVVHGGISATQLWEVDGRVALAGAGLPWQEASTTGGDLRALASALEDIGFLPAALAPLRNAPDGMTGAEALTLLDGSAFSPATPATEQPDAAENSAAQGTPPDVPEGVGAPAAPLPVSVIPPSVAAAPVAVEEATPHDGTPIVLGTDGPETGTPGVDIPAPELAPRPVPAKSRKAKSALQRGPGRWESPPAPESRSEPARPQPRTASAAGPAPVTAPAATEAAPVAVMDELAPPPAGTVAASAPAALEAPQVTPAGVPVPAFSTAPAGTVETPQERRRRQNEERLAQAKLDALAAAARKAERLREGAQNRPPEPVRIGFTASSPAVIGDGDLPEWTPPELDAGAQDGAPPPVRPTLKMRTVERLPESLRRPPEPDPMPEPAPPSGRLPARHMAGTPIRIGWDEDDSWRVVKTVDGPPAPARRRAPRWLVPLAGGVLAALLVASLVVGVGPRLRRPAVTAAPCCDVTFTLRGAAGVTARLSVVAAPARAGLTPGQALGRAPGQLHLPVAGTYRLKVVADGYGPGELNVTVPRARPVSINLGP